MTAAVIVFPGSNCDRDMEVALAEAFGTPPIRVWHRESTVPDVGLIAVPGGFSYGDYLRSGAMATQSPVMRDVVAKANRGVPVLGVCNGFQILTEAGLLPGVLMRNAGLRFICRDVLVRCETTQSIFTEGYTEGSVQRIPVAHNEGNYFADDDTLDRLENNSRVAFRYCDENGATDEAANPNGSARNIAGILNEAGNVLGMMPHPERAADAKLGGTDGRALFETLAATVGA